MRRPLFTGYTRDGGYATHVDRRRTYVFHLPDRTTPGCAVALRGLIGWRSLKIAGDAEPGPLWLRRGGAYRRAGRKHQGRSVYAFVRPGDDAARDFASSLGALGGRIRRVAAG